MIDMNIESNKAGVKIKNRLSSRSIGKISILNSF